MSAQRLGLLGLSLMMLTACQQMSPIVPSASSLSTIAAAGSGPVAEPEIRQQLERNPGVRVKTLNSRQVSPAAGIVVTEFSGTADVMIGSQLDYSVSFEGRIKAGDKIDPLTLRVRQEGDSVSRQIWDKLAVHLDDRGRIPDWVRQGMASPRDEVRVTPIGQAGSFRFSAPGTTYDSTSDKFYVLVKEYRLEGTYDRKGDRLAIEKQTLTNSYKKAKQSSGQH